MKNSWLVGGLAVVVVGGAFLWGNPGSLLDQTAAIGKKKNPTPVVSASPAANYTQLSQQYRSARIQFNDACQASPVNLSFTNGSKMLLDNRAAKAHTISFNGASYTLPAYSYQVITVSSPTLPAKLTFNCDSSVNIATVQVNR